MEQQVTVKEVLEQTAKMLGEISIPASLIESIGIPVARAINNLKLCTEAMDRDEAEQRKKAEEPQILEAVPEEGQAEEA